MAGESGHVSLESHLWAVENFASNRVQAFLDHSVPNVMRWLDNLLLYDRTVIPLQDFLVPTVLTSEFGQRRLIRLIESGALGFVRLKGGVAYIAPGSAPSKDGGFLSFVHPAYKRAGGTGHALPSAEEMILKAEGALRQAVGGPIDPAWSRCLAAATVELDASTFISDIGQRILEELVIDDSLRHWTGTSVANGKLRLPGAPGTLTVYSGALSRGGDAPPDRLAALLAANTELYIAASVGAGDLSTRAPIDQILVRRAMKHLCGSVASSSFAVVHEIVGVPSPGSLAFGSHAAFDAIMKLRDSSAGRSFRPWFHMHARDENPLVVARALSDLVCQQFVGDSLPYRIARFLVTNAVGFIPVAGPTLGTAASALDTFVVERVFRGRSPKFFIDKLQSISRMARAESDPPVTSGAIMDADTLDQ